MCGIVNKLPSRKLRWLGEKEACRRSRIHHRLVHEHKSEHMDSRQYGSARTPKANPDRLVYRICIERTALSLYLFDLCRVMGQAGISCRSSVTAILLSHCGQSHPGLLLSQEPVGPV